jgi:tRNA pseudouridine55 synthase
MNSGVVLLDKETGISSAGALARLKKKLAVERIGHAGTLDPMASGLLVCLTGRATRLASFAQDGAKIYSGSIEFGLRTSSDDITGEVLERTERFPDFAEVQSKLPAFIGSISQIPPRVSAIKIDGERSYKKARRGEDFEIKPRTVEVTFFEISPQSTERIGFRLGCSKGTYVRSLARDLGEALGCGGCLAELRREATEPFRIDAARTLERLSCADIAPWDILLPQAARIEASATESSALLNGQRASLLEFSKSHARELAAAEYAIFYRAGTATPLGLLKRAGESWDFALNIGE